MPEQGLDCSLADWIAGTKVRMHYAQDGQPGTDVHSSLRVEHGINAHWIKKWEKKKGKKEKHIIPYLFCAILPFDDPQRRTFILYPTWKMYRQSQRRTNQEGETHLSTGGREGKSFPKKEKVELVCREQADLPRSATSGFPSGSPGRFVRAISRAVERSIVFTLFL